VVSTTEFVTVEQRGMRGTGASVGVTVGELVGDRVGLYVGDLEGVYVGWYVGELVG
jgi:hypothetical protein